MSTASPDSRSAEAHRPTAIAATASTPTAQATSRAPRGWAASWTAPPGAWLPIGKMPRSSAHMSTGGITTRAASSATATFMVTMIPKSRSNGSAEPIRTANPPTVVAADVKKARPVRLAA